MLAACFEFFLLFSDAFGAGGIPIIKCFILRRREHFAANRALHQFIHGNTSSFFVLIIIILFLKRVKEKMKCE
nr:MAG TPA: hypothetical protein [Caudoviricetes sp.]